MIPDRQVLKKAESHIGRVTSLLDADGARPSGILLLSSLA